MPARGCGARKRRHKRSAVPGTAALCRDAARCSKLKAVPATSYRAKPATVRVEHARAWQRMLSGRRLDLLDPSPLDIEIEDIAHGLARVARWNGQTRGAHIYSVAQHCLLVEALARGRVPRLDRGRRLAVLLHDAPEYVIGDMISPFKVVIGDAYKAVERRLLEAIHRRFGLPVRNAPELEQLIKNPTVQPRIWRPRALQASAPPKRGGFLGDHRRLPQRWSGITSSRGRPRPHRSATSNDFKTLDQ